MLKGYGYKQTTAEILLCYQLKIKKVTSTHM